MVLFNSSKLICCFLRSVVQTPFVSSACQRLSCGSGGLFTSNIIPLLQNLPRVTSSRCFTKLKRTRKRGEGEKKKKSGFGSSVRAFRCLLVAEVWSKQSRFEVQTKTILIKRGPPPPFPFHPPVTEPPCPSVLCSWINYSREQMARRSSGRFVGVSVQGNGEARDRTAAWWI